jgi:hypothetical protein
MSFRAALAIAACIVLSWSSIAGAQMSEGEKKAAARAAYTEGIDLQEKGKPTEALARFEAAQALFDAPTHLLHIAECQALTGKLVEASETYELLVRRQLPPGSPPAFVQAQDQGRAELAQLRERIPTLRVTVKPAPSTLQNLQITLNDRVMPPELVGIARPINPGAYKVAATANGYATAAPVAVNINDKETQNIELTLQPRSGGAVTVPPPPATAGGGAPAGAAPPGAPPPYEGTAPKPAPKPSQTGLLLGARVGVFVPSGSIAKDRSFSAYASAGPGFGVDAFARVARMVLVGGTLEVIGLGGPDSNRFPSGTRPDVRTRSFLAAFVLGILPNVDKLSFIGDASLGYRSLSQRVSLNNVRSEEDWSGVEIGLNAGVAIPIGPIRVAPKAGVSFGVFNSRDCSAGLLLQNATGCEASTGDLVTGSHSLLSVNLAVYWAHDLSKNAISASR